MDFEIFARTRDLLYLAALCFGAGLGCILNRYKKATVRFRNLTVTGGLCFFSVTVTALTAAVILSNWRILSEPSLYLPLGVTAAVTALVFRFSPWAAFFLFAVAGAAVIWLGLVYLRFPAADGKVYAGISRELNNDYTIMPARNAREKPLPALSFHSEPEENGAGLELRAYSFSFAKAFPLIGGAPRGFIGEITLDNEILYRDPTLSLPFFPAPKSASGTAPPGFWEKFFTVSLAAEKLAPEEIPPGTDVVVYFDGTSLTLR